ncbi:MAG: lysine--tRNA ligase [Patescibacteria group bacterium]
MLEEIRKTRIEKLKKLKEAGMEPYPISCKRDFYLAEVLADFSKLSKRKTPLNLVGRLLAIREHGGSLFCDFADGSTSLTAGGPAKLQAYLKKDIIGEKLFSLFKEAVDVGDFLEFQGKLFLTKKKEKTIEIKEWRMLAKSLRPLPEKWHGLQDIEERFRKRYLDILMNKEVRERFFLRSKIISELRKFLEKEGFVEAETPILQPLAGGAAAQPFITHHNALVIDLYLRIAPELYLKRLLIAGLPKVYELGRNFRNEGIDAFHNPEFTLLEFYEAYSNAGNQRDFIEKMFRALVKNLFKRTFIEYNGDKIDFSKEFKVISFFEVLKRFALLVNAETASEEDFKLKAKQFGIEVSASDSKEKIADNIFKKICRPKIIQPTFIVDYPAGLLPLAKSFEKNKEMADAFQLVVGGLELVKGFSELNNPLEQKERFLRQEEAWAKGDLEAGESDDDFLEAMEYGMPPAGGVGIGLDRLAMLFANVKNIKEVILFPTMKPK